MNELLANRANIYAQDDTGASALTYAAQGKNFQRVECMEILLRIDAFKRGSMGGKMVKTRDNLGMTPLHHLMFGQRTMFEDKCTCCPIPSLTCERLRGVSADGAQTETSKTGG